MLKSSVRFLSVSAMICAMQIATADIVTFSGGGVSTRPTLDQSGDVTLSGTTIGTWSLTGDISTFASAAVTTSSGTAVGSDFRSLAGGAVDSWDLDFSVTLTDPGFEMESITVLGRNPDVSRNQGAASSTDINDLMSFSGLGAGLLSDSNNNLFQADGATVTSVSWLPGNRGGGDWTYGATEWSIAFDASGSSATLNFAADFLTDVFSEGIGFQASVAAVTTPVPEPSSFAAFALLGGGIVLRRYRKNNNA